MLRALVFISFLFFIGFWAKPAFAQTDTLPTKSLVVKLSPQHLFINGLHVDFEKPHKQNNRRSLIFSPRFYAGKTRTVDFLTGRYRDDEDNAQVLGYGAEIQRRRYISKSVDKTKEVTYVAYGVNFHHFGIDFDQVDWIEEAGSDGLNYYRLQMRPHHEKINQWGAVAMFGAQNPLFTDRILWDIFLGLGYKNSHSKTNYSTLRFNQNAFDFGYTGAYFLVGFKVGVSL